jgi:hypothetical protein
MRVLLLAYGASATDFCAGTQTVLRGCGEDVCPYTSDEKPVDAEWSEWSEWGECLCQGLKERHRHVKVHAVHGGEGVSGPTLEAEACEVSDNSDCNEHEPIDCKITTWTEWDDCECGRPQLYRTRMADAAEVSYCGKPCDAILQETKACPQDGCTSKVDCELSEWTEWDDCSVSCGGGQQARKRKVTMPAMLGGALCDDILQQVRPCETQCCDDAIPVDCVWGGWTEWSTCTATCDGGERSRQRVLETPPQNGGEWCADATVREVGTCNTVKCSELSPTNGAWTVWSEWSECTAECEGGFRTRERNIHKTPENGGLPAMGDFQQYEICNTQVCPVQDLQDCIFGDWSLWGGCSQACNGFKSRFREIKQHGRRGGQICAGALREAQQCNVDTEFCHRHDPKPCKWSQWSEWNECSATADGQREKVRKVLKEQEFSGEGCTGPLETIEACNTVPSPESLEIDCEWGEWEEWGACSKTCDSGVHMRWRGLKQAAKKGGKACEQGDSMQVEECAVQTCDAAIYCVWTDWGAWGLCSATCGGGEQERARTLHKTTDLPSDGLVLDSSQKSLLDFRVDEAPSTLVSVAGGVLLGLVAVGANRYWRPSSEAEQTELPGAQPLME